MLGRNLPLDYVSGLQPFRTLGDFKGYFIALCKRFETVTANCGEMDKNVLSPFLLDKAETFCVIKPFYFALCHFLPPFLSGPAPELLVTAKISGV
jgi:hypothetical protein